MMAAVVDPVAATETMSTVGLTAEMEAEERALKLKSEKEEAARMREVSVTCMYFVVVS